MRMEVEVPDRSRSRRRQRVPPRAFCPRHGYWRCGPDMFWRAKASSTRLTEEEAPGSTVSGSEQAAEEGE